MTLDDLKSTFDPSVEWVDAEIISSPEEDLVESLSMLTECGQLLDELTELDNKKLTRKMFKKIAKLSDAVYDYLNQFEDEEEV